MLKILNLEGNRLRNLPREVWLAPRLRELNCMNNEIVHICSNSIINNFDNSRNHMRGIFKHNRTSRNGRQENFIDKKSIINTTTIKKSFEIEKKSKKENILNNKNAKKEENASESDVIRYALCFLYLS